MTQTEANDGLTQLQFHNIRDSSACDTEARDKYPETLHDPPEQRLRLATRTQQPWDYTLDC